MIQSADEFRLLRTSDDLDEQRRAAHDEAPVAIWREIIARFPELRWWVAQNKTVPDEILAELASDADPRVRSMVAMKRKLGPELQLRLTADADESVRRQLASNARATRAALERLAVDPVAAIAEQARSRLAVGEHS